MFHLDIPWSIMEERFASMWATPFNDSSFSIVVDKGNVRCDASMPLAQIRRLRTCADLTLMERPASSRGYLGFTNWSLKMTALQRCK
jgi:hypothetical protein